MDIKKKKKYKFWGIFIIVVCITTYTIFNIYRSFREDARNSMTVSNKIPDDYNEVFNNSAKTKLHIQITSYFQLRNPVASINYNDQFDLAMTEINCIPSFDIKKDIVESYKKPSSTIAESYLPIDVPNITINYIPESKKSASKIYLSLVGDSVTTIVKNDSVVCYYLKPKNVVVQYSPNGVKEIFIEKEYYSPDEPIDMMFIKKKSRLYCLLMGPQKAKFKLFPNLLFDMVK